MPWFCKIAEELQAGVKMSRSDKFWQVTYEMSMGRRLKSVLSQNDQNVREDLEPNPK